MPPATKRNKPAKSDGVKKAVPRVPRACDNCRLRKSKCDGLLPCSFCQQHDSECTYDESRPKKQLDTKYIVSLERTVERFKDILGIPSDVEVTPEVLDEYDISRLGQLSRQNSSLHSVHHVATQTSPPGTPQGESPVACTLLESMVEATGRLNIDEDGNYDYSGSNSGLLLVERIRQRCDQLLNRRYGSGPNAAQERRSPAGTSSRLLHRPSSRPRSLTALPSWDIAVLYTNAVFSEAFSLFNFIHRPSFESRLQLYYSARNAGLEPTLEDTRFEALLNAMFALGELFNAAGDSSQAGSAAREARSEQFFAAAQQSLDLTDCRDTLSLQALLCSIIYLQGSGQIPSCYTYLSLAMTAAVRMGMHRADSLSKFDPLEREVRKRIFWTIRAMDSYITTVLDLPRTLRDDDTDQAYPVELDDDAITPQNIGQPTASSISLMSSVNAHTKLSLVLVKAKNITSGGNDGEHKLNNRYQVDYAKIVEAEKDLIEWTSHLPSYNKLPEPVPKDIERAQMLLRVAHGHVQMVLYRPFLYHIARRNADANFDYRAFACASACIKAAMQVVWLVQALDNAQLLNGPSWLLFFTLFMAVVILTLFVITNKDDPTVHEYYSAAQRGFLILDRFASCNQMARTYAESLRPLFCDTSTRSSAENALDMTLTSPNTLNPSTTILKSSNSSHQRNISSTLRNGALHDVFLVSAAEPMMDITSRPAAINIPPLHLSATEDPSAEHVYLQAMNCTPTNFFEGFSSETAMMDYFSWHEQDQSEAASGFQFQ